MGCADWAGDGEEWLPILIRDDAMAMAHATLECSLPTLRRGFGLSPTPAGRGEAPSRLRDAHAEPSLHPKQRIVYRGRTFPVAKSRPVVHKVGIMYSDSPSLCLCLRILYFQKLMLACGR